jgi:large subunit ribosomal protein L23
MKDTHHIIKKLLLTEKGTVLTETANQYQFRVDRAANKLEIRKAVEDMFGVSVVRVNTMTRPGKRRRERSMNYGFTPDWKRAVVTLKEGDSIDLT